ncbi:MAG: hypothetical protein WAM14_23065, partial [Candidatus Nitrosopolaris sp.]
LDYGTKLFLGNDLRFVEIRLRAIIDILDSNTNNPTFLLYSIKYNIDLETRNKILQSIGVMLNEIRELKEFDLEGQTESLKRKIDVNLEEIWTTLLDTRPEKMRGMYKMSQSDEDSVRSYILKLVKMVEHLLFNKSIE